MDWIIKHLKPEDLPKHVVHVGGFDGYESHWYEEWGAKSTWFEPLPEKFQDLQLKGLNVYNFALGSKADVVKFYVSNNLQSSSILEPTGHLKKYPETIFNKIINVEVRTLDSFNIKDCDMLVLDTQGYELEVLKGAHNTLNNVKIIFCEVSIVKLYKDSPLLADIETFLPDFKLVDINWVDGIEKGWGDALFIKKL
jgi:FkbM family methyltransferase